jgi:hypothetical protein
MLVSDLVQDAATRDAELRLVDIEPSGRVPQPRW